MSQITQQHGSYENARMSKIDPRILLLALGMFAVGTDTYVVTGILSTVAHAMGVSVSVAGQLVTAFSLTYGLDAPILAALTGRWAPHRVLIASLVLFCLSNVGSALAPTFPLLMLTRILTGCCAAVYAPLTYSTGVALAPPEKRGRALALVVIGQTVATVLGAPLGTWIGERFGWHFSFAMVAVLAGIAFLALLLSGLPSISTPPVMSLRQRLTPVTQPRLIIALLPAFFVNIAVFNVYTYISPLLQHNLPLVDISGLLVAFGLGIVVGNWSGGVIADRVGPLRPMVIGLVLFLIIQIIMPLTTVTWLGALITLFVYSLVAALAFIPQQHRLLSLAPEHANVMLALNNSTLFLGIAGGAALGGLALRFVAVTQLGWISVGPVLLAMLFLAISIRMSRDVVQIQEHEQPEKQSVMSPK